MGAIRRAPRVGYRLGLSLARPSLGVAITSSSVSPDGGRLLIGGSSGEVGLFDLGAVDGRQLPELEAEFAGDVVAHTGHGAVVLCAPAAGGQGGAAAGAARLVRLVE